MKNKIISVASVALFGLTVFVASSLQGNAIAPTVSASETAKPFNVLSLIGSNSNLFAAVGNFFQKSPQAADATGTPILKGDLNNDGLLRIADVNILSGRINANAPYDIQADMDDDGIVDSYDLYRLSGIVDGSQPSDPRLPIRNLTLNTLGHSVNDVVQTDAALYEPGVKTLNAKYSKQGNSRYQCQPPVLHISFDKFDSSGKRRIMFLGRTTMGGGLTTLQYQKVRFMPNCDVWEMFDPGSNSVGFDGTLNVNLRESYAYAVMRAFGIPTDDVIGYANVKFISTDTDLVQSATPFQYIILQKDDEPDDQIPFVTQFDFSKLMVEGGGNYGSYDWHVANRFTGFDLTGGPNGNIHVNLDPENQIRYFLLTDFMEIGDRGIFHNEDYGYDATNDIWKTAPNDFDISFFCNTPGIPSSISSAISQLPSAQQAHYKEVYYRVARNIFDNPDSLNNMLYMIDQFPFPVNKNVLKKYMKLTFHNYAQYYGSASFATAMGQVYTPFNIAMSDSVYNATLAAFNSECHRVVLPLPDFSVTIDSTPTLQVKYDENHKEISLNGNFDVTINVGSSADLKLSRRNLPFSILANNTTPPMPGDPVQAAHRVEVLSLTSDTPLPTDGNFYTILHDTSAHLHITGEIDPAYIPGGLYTMSLDHLDFRGLYTPSTKPVSPNISNAVAIIGEVIPTSLTVLSPNGGESFKPGAQMTVTWSSHNYPADKQVDVYLSKDLTSAPGHVSLQAVRVTNTGETTWKINDNAPDGDYYIRITCLVQSDCTPGASKYSFRIEKDYVAPTLSVIGTPSLALSYDNDHHESALTAHFTAKLDSGSRSILIPKSYTFTSLAYNESDKGSNSYSQNPMYTRPSDVIDYNADYYQIPSNRSVLFDLKFNFLPGSMFPGRYHATLYDVRTGQSQICPVGFVCVVPINPADPIVVEGNRISASDNRSTWTWIYGERSPWISFVAPNPAPVNLPVTITGYHFEPTGNVVTFLFGVKGQADKNAILNSTDKGTHITFTPSVLGIPPGGYAITVTSPLTGASNNYGLTIGQPSTDQFVTPSQNPVRSGDTVTLTFGVPNNTISSMLILTCPANVTATWTGSEGILPLCNASTPLNPANVGSIPIQVTNSGIKWQNITLQYSVKTADNPNLPKLTTSQLMVQGTPLIMRKAPNQDLPANQDQGVLPSPATSPYPSKSPTPSPSKKPTYSPTPSPYFYYPYSPSSSPSPKPVSAGNGDLNVNLWAAIWQAIVGR